MYCCDCKWFDRHLFEEGDHHSWCNRHPPVYVGPAVTEMTGGSEFSTFLWAHPAVAVYDWCGEWEPYDIEGEHVDE